VLLAGFGDNGVLDDDQESTARSMAKRRPWFCPVTVSGGDWKLDRGHAVQGSEESDEQGQI
jgi:hypothetical protein